MFAIESLSFFQLFVNPLSLLLAGFLCSAVEVVVVVPYISLCVVLQSRSGGVPTLYMYCSGPGICCYCYNYSTPPCPIFINSFWIFLFLPFIIPPPPTRNLLSLQHLYLPVAPPPSHSPPLPARNTFQLDVTHTLHPSASDDRLCALHHMPASSAVSRVRLPPICGPRPAPRGQW